MTLPLGKTAYYSQEGSLQVYKVIVSQFLETIMLKIGEFSRLSQISIRALHIYDDQGLLRPEHVVFVKRKGYHFIIEKDTTLMIGEKK